MQCASRDLDLATPVVMGVLNVTPDSFSDGGSLYSSGRVDPGKVVARAQLMIEQGAGILDIGGESTRPNAIPVDTSEELRRVMPVLERLLDLDVILSVDTSKAEVAIPAIEAGVHIINDVRALSQPGMLKAVVNSDVGICLMHMQGQPGTMQHKPQYGDVTRAVYQYLDQRVKACTAEGMSDSRIMIDPGFGFGKTLAHNYQMLRELDRFSGLGLPLVVGVSRKSMLSKVVGHDPGALIAAGAMIAKRACISGAKVIRTHDVGETVRAVNAYLHNEPLEVVQNQTVMEVEQLIEAVLAED